MRYILLSLLLLISATLTGQDRADTTITATDYFIEGVRHYTERDLDKAKILLDKALEKNPTNDAAYYYLGLTHWRMKDGHTAEAYLQKAVQADTANFWYRVNLAQFYAEQGDIAKSISIYEEVAKSHPNKHSVLYDILDLYTANQQYDKSLETLDRIEALKGENEVSGEVRYELLIRQGNYLEATRELEVYQKRYPSPRGALILGDLYKSMYKDTLAILCYEQALALEPGFSSAHLGLAETYRTRGEFENYFPHINVFMADPKANPAIKSQYMREVVITPHIVRQYLEKVDEMVNNTINAHPSDTSILYMAGAYYIQTGRDSTGKNIFKEAAECYPEDYKANIEYVSLLYYMNAWDELAEQVERSLHYFPGDMSLLEILPIAYWQGGDIDKAIGQYQKIIQSLPSKDPSLYRYYSSLGDLYHEKGNLSKAYSYYEKGLKINPEYNPVLNNYAYFLCLEGKKMKKAAKMSKKTVISEPDNPTYLDTYAWILYRLGEYAEAKIHIKRAMIYGGNEDATLLDHYAEILFALKEYDLAFIYWEQADKKDPSLGIGEKIKVRKGEMKR